MSMELIALIGIGVTVITIGACNSGHPKIRGSVKNSPSMVNLRERMAGGHLEGLLDGLREAFTGRRVAEEARERK